MTRKVSLVLFPGALGDFLCFLPALTAISRSAPVDLYARGDFADLVAPGVRVHSLERQEICRLFIPGTEREVHSQRFFARYGSVYSWMGSQETVFVRNLERVGAGPTSIFPFRPRHPGMHLSEYYLSCLGEKSFLPPVVALRPEARLWCEDFWQQHSLTGKAVLVLAPGSGAREKNWPVNYYQSVAQWWRRRTGGSVLALLGPVEEERGGFEPLLDMATPARNLNLAQVSALLAKGQCYLGNDSGITHLAAVIGAPTVALFGPSDIRQWAPRGPQVRVLISHAACSPCAIAAMKDCSHRACLNLLQPDAVIREIAKSLATANLTRLGAEITV